MEELPVIGQQVSERVDAARNRARVLAAAERLFADHGVDGVSMDQIAAAAGVGKGTVYRRFGDQNGLAMALLDTHERRFQDKLLSGQPPLGPAGPPARRLEAFLVAALHLVVTHNDLYRLAERGGTRTHSGLYGFYRRHVAHLLELTDLCLDTDAHADHLLASLDASLVHHQLTQLGLTEQRLAAVQRRVVDSLLGGC